MQSKRIGSKIMIATFVIFVCCSWGWWFLPDEFINSLNNENRTLATRPTLSVDNYTTFPEEYEAYYNDNLPFRDILVKINSSIDYFVFKKSAADTNVIVGKDNWLFYGNTSDGDPLGAYQGELFTEEELQNIAQNCVDTEQFLSDRGKEFVIFIAPNKERIYSEFMPEQYGEPADMYKTLQLVQYLRENTDLRIVYPYDELIAAKNELSQNIYYKTDTHWNWIGGYVGASALLDELGIDMPDITSDELEIIAGDETSGDLARMLDMNDILKSKEYEYSVVGYNNHNMETIESDFSTVIRQHAEDADPRKVYVYRDSFASFMAIYIGSQFNDCYMRYHETYSYDDFVQEDPDIFIYETVERYVDRLGTFSIQQ